MESNALRYFCFTFSHLGWASLYVFNSDRPILIIITDTDYLYVYVPDNRYAEPIFIYCYKVHK